MNKIYLSGILKDSLVDGEGLRDVIFVTGCDNHCEGCQNPETWKVENGKAFNIKDVVKQMLQPQTFKDITISGGDPLSYQKQSVLTLVKEIKNSSNKNIWLYTGYVFEDLLETNDNIIYEILSLIDVLVDGRFDKNKRDITLKFKGSSNQRIIDMKKTLHQGKVVILK